MIFFAFVGDSTMTSGPAMADKVWITVTLLSTSSVEGPATGSPYGGPRNVPFSRGRAILSAAMPTASLDTEPGPDDTGAGAPLDGEARPWGAYLVLDDGPLAKVKRITVDPGQRLSLQLHHRRAEHWFVVSGTAVVTLGDTELELAAGDAVDIPTGTAHRVRNPGDEPLVFVEVQLGDYFGEDDIVRLEDDYGRAG